MANKSENSPIKLLRSGALSVSIFKRTHEKRDYHTVSLSRAFTRDDGKTWEYTDAIDADDAPRAARLLDMAFAWLTAQKGARE